ncbi:prolipoprotein diacylglyceryl transferase [Candidatus Falkowbacteria bacterium]|jgi:phosphatidylglycerol:prolipoprotein diacylglycerol transferase|nr:prolipoprotein diacylglyceryl transferase [Candidatus Falkowbacteria bacterium]
MLINWLHTFHPQAILLSFGPIHLYWYGLFIILGILAALFISLKLAPHYKLSKETVFDLSFWLIIFGLLGARIYDIFLNLPYYFQYPLDALKIWQGGLAIHGAIIAGLLVIYFFAKKQKKSFWTFTSLFAPGLALGQAIGRFGNYFNQELFGLPTNKPWGIPIDLINRPVDYITNQFFHPTFLYESLGCFLIFIVLMLFNYHLIKKNKLTKQYYQILLVGFYMISYSVLRFCLEFIKIDETPIFLTLRWPQVISLLIILISFILLILNHHEKKKQSCSK